MKELNTDNTHTLDQPIRQGDNEIKTITLRKPGSGELRGVSLSDLVNLDVSALHKVLPRITTPTLTEADVSKLDPADLLQLAGIVSGFFMTKAMRASMGSPT
ncbi:TPA: phage tail assembly protein [Burkholderia territorii]|uniref:phage tail assembly protein n=1 Tax=Burkholderia territorii TaxID=1503055 RepID=UPI0011C77885|nr:phage tail assembly protein [Burkholderia territorii]TXG20387.1 phage tail assembly protein [Burkholderia territorii]HDR8859371.1 phage tail assembly protein [Burkholderia territorii]HDR8866142.1 phage tail assembly protein [Burkholderia territorii]HDR8871880.1 phage tail assembly protein [Burkholderia territorii]HDR8877098.1 phage tail assembly protein [Burkholderia territorii]